MQRASTFSRPASFDRQGVNAAPDQRFEGTIHEAMSAQSGLAIEAGAADPHPEMPAFACARMAGVQVAFIHDFELRGLQGGAQGRFDFGRGDRRDHFGARGVCTHRSRAAAPAPAPAPVGPADRLRRRGASGRCRLR